MTLPVLSFSDFAGLLGVGALLVAYFLLQRGDLDQQSAKYSLLNGIGSGLILLSLFYDFNLASALVEGAWFLISLYGLYKVSARRRGS